MKHLNEYNYNLFGNSSNSKKDDKKKKKEEAKRKAEELKAKTAFVPKILKSLPLPTPENTRRFLNKVHLFKMADKIYALKIADDQVRSFIFMRVQEFYESQNPRFFQNDYQIADFMKWYKEDFKRKAKYFTYGTDWLGFNIPSEAINACMKGLIEDPNEYDKILFAVVDAIKKQEDGRFYLIGSDLSEGDLLKHELAHGMYYTSTAYKNAMDNIINKMTPKMKKKISDTLLGMGYNQSVVNDEIQAYIATDDFNQSHMLVDEKPVYKFSGGFGKNYGTGKLWDDDDWFYKNKTKDLDENDDIVIGSRVGQNVEEEYVSDECPYCHHKFNFMDYIDDEDELPDHINCPNKKCGKKIELEWGDEEDLEEELRDECPECGMLFNYEDLKINKGKVKCPECEEPIRVSLLEMERELSEQEEDEEIQEGVKTNMEDKEKDECPYCKAKFNFHDVPEAGPGYIKCPSCKKIVLEEDLEEEQEIKEIGKVSKFSDYSKIEYDTPEDVKLAEKICDELTEVFERYYETIGDPHVVMIDYSKYFKTKRD